MRRATARDCNLGILASKNPQIGVQSLVPGRSNRGFTVLLGTRGTAGRAHRAQSRLIRREKEIRIFGYFSFFMHARIISELDFQTIHLKIITAVLIKRAFLWVMI